MRTASRENGEECKSVCIGVYVSCGMLGAAIYLGRESSANRVFPQAPVLSYAARGGQLEIITWLLDEGAEVRASSRGQACATGGVGRTQDPPRVSRRSERPTRTSAPVFKYSLVKHLAFSFENLMPLQMNGF